MVKFLGYAGLLLLVGPVMVLALLWPHRIPRRGPARLVWTGLGLVVGSTLAALWLQAPYATGGGILSVGPGDLRDVLGSTFGAVMLVRLGVVIAEGARLRRASARAGDLVPAGRRIDVGASSPRIDVHDARAAKIGEVDQPTLRGQQRH